MERSLKEALHSPFVSQSMSMYATTLLCPLKTRYYYMSRDDNAVCVLVTVILYAIIYTLVIGTLLTLFH